MKENFWQGKNILITGSSGFIGSHLASYLARRGAFIVGVSSRPLDSAMAQMRGLEFPSGQFIFEQGNLSDISIVSKLLARHSIDTVFHLAASAIVSQAAKSPTQTIQSNVSATMNVLEAVRLAGVRRAVIASSDKAYGDHSFDQAEPLPYREDYSLKGLDIYSSSKACADMLSQAYAFQYKIPIGIVRCCNVYGPGDLNFTRLIPRTAMRLLSGQPPTLKTGHEDVLREYMYIDDVLAAYNLVAQSIEEYYGKDGANMPGRGQESFGWPAFNVGSYTREQTKILAACGNICRVRTVVEALRRELADIAPEVVDAKPQFIEIPDEYSDSAKLLALGFEPHMSFSEGLAKSAAWYKEHFETLKEMTY